MSANVVLNGVSYTIPDPGDSAWGQDVTDYMVAQATGLLQKAGGTFSLTAEVDFGATYGLKSAYFKSRTASAASAGQLRLARADLIKWRNQAGDGDLSLGVNSSNLLTFEGTVIQSALSVSDTTTIDLTLAANVLSGVIVPLSITDAHISASAAIAYSKLSIAAGDIAYSKLTIGPGDIAYSKLTLTGSIVNADINASAGIVDTKLATISTAGKVSNSATTATSANTNSAIVARDGSGNFTAGTITAALTGTASGNTTYTPNQYGVVVAGAANAMTVIAPDASTSKVLTSGGSSANPTWQAVASAPTSQLDTQNLGIACSVASSALTIAMKQADGSTNPSSGSSAVNISFRSATATNGGYVNRSVTGALSLVISSGSTLGLASGITSYVYVYAIDNAGTVELGASRCYFPPGIYSSTAEGGAGAADSNNVIYSTTARSSVSMRPIARLTVNEATAGTWASAPTVVSLENQFFAGEDWPVVKATTSNTSILTTATTNVVFSSVSFDSHNGFATGTGKYTIPITGKYEISGAVFTSNTGSLAVSQEIRLQANQSGSASNTQSVGGFQAQGTSANGARPNGSASFNCVAGDLLWFTVINGTGNTITLSNSADGNYITVKMVSRAS